MSLLFLESSTASSFSEGKLRPHLSVGIPTWNRLDALKQQLAQLLPCLAPDHEVVICDNGSDDGTWAWLQRLVQTSNQAIRCVRNGANLGADVNYLRVFEATRGEWVWLVGDDDSLDFVNVLPHLLSRMASTSSDTILLLDDPSIPIGGNAIVTWTHVDVSNFFKEANDEAGMLLLQLGRVVSRQPLRFLRSAFLSGIGTLHSYAMIYGAQITNKGVDIARLAVLLDRQQTDPRWNIIQGHMGAWDASRKMFPDYLRLVDSREIRSRRKAFRLGVLKRAVERKPFVKGELVSLLKRLPLRDGMVILVVVGMFYFNETAARKILFKLKPLTMQELTAQEIAKEITY